MDTRTLALRFSRRTLIHTLGVTCIVVAAGSVAACGKSDANSRTVRMTGEMRFEPATLTIKKGETVTWTNDNDMVHTATADPSKVRDAALIELPLGAAVWDSGNISQGQEWRHTFDIPGRYKYLCIPHQIVGMVGEIIVEE